MASPALLNGWLRDQSPAFAAWDMGGELRLRYDVKANHGSFPDSVPDRDFIRDGQENDDRILYLREKIHVGYNHDWFTAFVEGRDSSTSGDDRNPNPFADCFDLHQAFVKIGNPDATPLSLKIGRQEMTYGDERFVEVADWSNLERTFDAIKLRYETDAFWVDGFLSHYVIPDDGSFNEANWHDLFSGIYASSRTLIPRQVTDFYFLAHNANAASATVVNSSGAGVSARDVYTIGMRVASLPGDWAGWDYGAEIAGQFGSVNQGGQRLEHEALAADVRGGYTWRQACGTPRLGLDFTYGSGDSSTNDNRHETFDLLFGAAHKFYGIMDVTGLRNTISPSINFTVTPLRRLTLRTDYFLYWLADTHDLSYAEAGKGRTANGYGVHPEFSSYFGSEVDVVATYAVAHCLNLQAGYSHFFVGDYVTQSVNSVPANGGAVDADFFYLQTKFVF